MELLQRHLPGLLALMAALSASAAFARDVAITSSDSVATLPTGDDGAYRERMLHWEGPPVQAATHDEVIATLPLTMPLRHIHRLSSSFGVREDPFGASRRMHSGIDLPGVTGSPVMATGPGVVSFASWAGGYGNMVEIRHGNGLHTRYGHLLRPTVAPGEVVYAGKVIGLMGSTGRSTGTHLHYEVRLWGRAVNPLANHFAAREAAPVETPDLPRPVAIEPRWQGWSSPQVGKQLPVSVIR